MDPSGLITILSAIPNMGSALAGLLIFIVWYFDRRDIERYRKDVDKSLAEMRQMYQNNASLAKRTIEMAEALNQVIILNTETMSRLNERITTNQYCPMQRKDER